MEARLLLWLYLLSAGWSAFLYTRRPEVLPRRYLVAVVAIGLASATALFCPPATDGGFLLATAGFVLFLLGPVILTRIGRAQAKRGRFGAAAGFVGAACVVFPARFLVAERDAYRTAARDEDRTRAEAFREWLSSRPSEEASLRAVPMTAALLGSFLLAWLLAVFVGGFGGSSSLLTLMKLGAISGELVRQGEWFRLLTAMFLHIGLLHLGMNVIAVLIAGRWVEPVVGAAGTAIVFLLGGLAGNLASFLLYGFGPDPYVSAGASGGAMALFGAALVVALRSPASPLRSRRVQTLAVLLVATVFLGVVEEGIDNGAHLGGLLAGAVLTPLLTGPRRLPARAVRAAAMLMGAAAVSAFAWMLTTLPSWSETRVLEGLGHRFTAPARLRPSKDGKAGDYDAGALGAASVRVVPMPPDVGELVRERLSLVAKSASRAAGVTVEAPRELERRDAWTGGGIRLDADASGRAAAVYARSSPDRTRAALLTVHLGSADPALFRWLVPPILNSFTFE